MRTGKVMGEQCSNLLGLQDKDLDVHRENIRYVNYLKDRFSQIPLNARKH